MTTSNSDEQVPVILADPELATQDLGRPPVLDTRGTAHDDAEDERQRQQAFDAGYEWRGKKLKGWTSSRDNLFGQHRLAMGAPLLESCLQDMDGFGADAARILWLCHHTDEDWSLLRVAAPAMERAIERWADEHISIQEGTAARILAMNIYFDARRNQHEAAPLAGKAHGDDLGN